MSQLIPASIACGEVGGPYGRRKAVLRIVRHLDSFFFCIKRCNVADRAEDFLFLDAGIFGQTGKDGGFNIGAAVAFVAEFGNAAACDHVPAQILRQIVITFHLVTVLMADQRAHLALEVLLHELLQPLQLAPSAGRHRVVPVGHDLQLLLLLLHRARFDQRPLESCLVRHEGQVVVVLPIRGAAP